MPTWDFWRSAFRTKTRYISFLYDSFFNTRELVLIGRSPAMPDILGLLVASEAFRRALAESGLTESPRGPKRGCLLLNCRGLECISIGKQVGLAYVRVSRFLC